jgi:hypothetical protein
MLRESVTKAVEKTWLTRYPWPSLVQFDHGSKFKEAFNDLVETYNTHVQKIDNDHYHGNNRIKDNTNTNKINTKPSIYKPLRGLY